MSIESDMRRVWEAWTKCLPLPHFRKPGDKSWWREQYSRLAQIDDALDAYVRSAGRPTSERLPLIATLIEACETLGHPPREGGAAGVAGYPVEAVRMTRRRAQAEAKELLATCFPEDTHAHGLTGWARFRAATAPIVGGAQRNCLILRETYWSEALSPSHPPVIAGRLSPFNIWSEADTHLNYVEWMRRSYIPSITDAATLARLCRHYARSVAYGSDDDRANWRLTVRRGLLIDCAGKPFDTEKMHGWLGDGYAAFVRTTDNELLAHSHAVGAFHHSSLASGKPVLAVGDISVRNGRVSAIVNKSGHYTPSSRHVLLFAFWLRGLGADLSETTICMHPYKPPQWTRLSSILSAPEFIAETLTGNG